MINKELLGNRLWGMTYALFIIMLFGEHHMFQVIAIDILVLYFIIFGANRFKENKPYIIVGTLKGSLIYEEIRYFAVDKKTEIKIEGSDVTLRRYNTGDLDKPNWEKWRTSYDIKNINNPDMQIKVLTEALKKLKEVKGKIG